MTLERFRWALEGKPYDPARLPPDVRAYRAARMFGWTLEQIDAAPAARLDWLLEMGRIEDETRAKGGG